MKPKELRKGQLWTDPRDGEICLIVERTGNIWFVYKTWPEVKEWVLRRNTECYILEIYKPFTKGTKT